MRQNLINVITTVVIILIKFETIRKMCIEITRYLVQMRCNVSKLKHLNSYHSIYNSV